MAQKRLAADVLNPLELAAMILEGTIKDYQSMNEDQQDSFLDYLLDEFGNKYNDRKKTKLIEKNPRQLQEAARDILGDYLEKHGKQGLPPRAYLGAYRALHQGQQQQRQKPKLDKSHEREQIRLRLVRNEDRLPDCDRIGGVSFLTAVMMPYDDSYNNQYVINVPNDLFEDFVDSYVKIETILSKRLVFARVLSTSQRRDQIEVSHVIFQTLKMMADKNNQVQIQRCNLTPDPRVIQSVTMLDITPYLSDDQSATQGEIESALQSMLSMIPGIAQGMELFLYSLGIWIRINAVYGTDGAKMFAGTVQLSGREDREITVEITGEDTLIQCDVCSRIDQLYHCGCCMDAIYCSKECQSEAYLIHSKIKNQL